MKIPKHIRVLMPSIRRCEQDEEPMFESSDQAEARLSKQFQNDKQRTVVKNLAGIKRAKGMLERAQDPHLRKQLRQRIKTMTAENTETQRYS